MEREAMQRQRLSTLAAAKELNAARDRATGAVVELRREHCEADRAARVLREQLSALNATALAIAAQPSASSPLISPLTSLSHLSEFDGGTPLSQSHGSSLVSLAAAGSATRSTCGGNMSVMPGVPGAAPGAAPGAPGGATGSCGSADGQATGLVAPAPDAECARCIRTVQRASSRSSSPTLGVSSLSSCRIEQSPASLVAVPEAARGGIGSAPRSSSWTAAEASMGSRGASPTRGAPSTTRFLGGGLRRAKVSPKTSPRISPMATRPGATQPRSPTGKDPSEARTIQESTVPVPDPMTRRVPGVPKAKATWPLRVPGCVTGTRPPPGC